MDGESVWNLCKMETSNLTPIELSVVIATAGFLLSAGASAFIAGYRWGTVKTRLDIMEREQANLATKDQLAGVKEDVAEIKGMFRMTLKETKLCQSEYARSRAGSTGSRTPGKSRRKRPPGRTPAARVTCCERSLMAGSRPESEPADENSARLRRSAIELSALASSATYARTENARASLL